MVAEDGALGGGAGVSPTVRLSGGADLDDGGPGATGVPQALDGGGEVFRQPLDASPSAMVVVRRDREILHVNPRLVELFGYSREELVGQPYETLVPGSPSGCRATPPRAGEPSARVHPVT